MSQPVAICAETPLHRAAIHAVHVASFPSAAEADLVDALRAQAQPLVSLVGIVDGDIVGHILFSPVVLDHPAQLALMGLAPMAVAPRWQRCGIGSALVRSGLARCREISVDAIFVLGHPDYYPRFGFEPAIRFGIRCEYDAPPEAFMAMELQSGCLGGVAGTVQFHPAFKDV